jgi:hypothetical protein
MPNANLKKGGRGTRGGIGVIGHFNRGTWKRGQSRTGRTIWRSVPGTKVGPRSAFSRQKIGFFQGQG